MAQYLINETGNVKWVNRKRGLVRGTDWIPSVGDRLLVPMSNGKAKVFRFVKVTEAEGQSGYTATVNPAGYEVD